MYGPGEVRQAREIIDKSLVEVRQSGSLPGDNCNVPQVCYKPRVGLPGVGDRDREEVST